MVWGQDHIIVRYFRVLQKWGTWFSILVLIKLYLLLTLCYYVAHTSEHHHFWDFPAVLSVTVVTLLTGVNRDNEIKSMSSFEMHPSWK